MKELAIVLIFCLVGGASLSGVAATTMESGKTAESLRAFDQAARVFQHVRCLNCHPAGDRPTQGSDMHAHIMNIQRGAQNHGMIGAKCATCHGVENNDSSGVPGAPKWGVAPKELAWQGLSTGELCRKLKTGSKPGLMAGDMTPEQFIHHNADDPLVGWAWHPGASREPVPFTQKKFGKLVAEWIKTGAACPE